MATSLGRGSIYLMVVSVVFMVSGYLVHAMLGRWLGPAEYGVFGVVLYLATLVQNLSGDGIPQAASKYIAEDNEKAYAVRKLTERLQLVFSFVVFVLYFALAENIALLLGDITLVPYIQLSAFLIPIGAFFSLYSNSLNGLRWYGKQAKVQLFSSVFKVAAVFTLVYFGFSIYGAIIGYLIGSAAGLVAGWHYLRGIPKSVLLSIDPREILGFAAPVIILAFTFTFLMSADLLFVKKIIVDNTSVGYYTAASTLARIPFFIFTAVGLALFPAIAKSTSSKDMQQTKSYINESLRYTLILLVPTIFLMSAASDQIVLLFYSAKFIEAGEPLSILVFGFAFFTLFSILYNVISASGRPKVSMAFTVILAPILVILLNLLIPSNGLVGAALAMLATSIIGLLLVSSYVYIQFHALVSIKSFCKIVFSSGIIYILSLNIILPTIFLPLEFLILFLIYLLLLYFLRELSRQDLGVANRMLPRKFQINLDRIPL